MICYRTEKQRNCKYLEYGLHLILVDLSISILIKELEVPFEFLVDLPLQ